MCLGTKGSPSHNDCAAAVRDGRGEPSRRKSRKKAPRPALPPPGRVGGVSDPEIYQRNGLPPKDTPQPCKANPNPERLGAGGGGPQDHPHGLQGNKMTPGSGGWRREAGGGRWRPPAPGSLGRAPWAHLEVPGSPWEQLSSSHPTPEERERALPCGSYGPTQQHLVPRDPKPRLGLGRMCSSPGGDLHQP